MNSIEIVNTLMLTDWPSRVCLPYGLDLLQLARWVNLTKENKAQPWFDIVYGEMRDNISGLDPIDLFCEIQEKCINYSLSHSYVICEQPRSIMFFDMHERFSFFSADLANIQELYPFDREVIWENFSLLQEADGDISLAEVFNAVQSI